MAARARRKKAAAKEMTWTLIIVAALIALVVPMILVAIPSTIRTHFSYLQYLPQAMVDTTTAGEFALGEAYLNATYAARDLAAAAYGGSAEASFAAVSAVHGVQMTGYYMMGNSMAEGASEVAGAYAALGQWYDSSASRVKERLEQPRRP